MKKRHLFEALDYYIVGVKKQEKHRHRIESIRWNAVYKQNVRLRRFVWEYMFKIQKWSCVYARGSMLRMKWNDKTSNLDKCWASRSESSASVCVYVFECVLESSHTVHWYIVPGIIDFNMVYHLMWVLTATLSCSCTVSVSNVVIGLFVLLLITVVRKIWRFSKFLSTGFDFVCA